ncbi:MAG: aminotransferase class IV [Bryobacteraceae bacterium]
MHRYLLHNDKILEAGAKCVSPGQVGLLAGWGVFSTIRVYDGVLFAFERHWARMRRDAALLRVPFPADSSGMLQGLQALVEANGAQNSTLRVVVVRNRGGIWEGPSVDRDFDVVAFTAGLKNWGAGVRLGIVEQARHAACEFAGTKVLSWGQNLAWNEAAASRGLDEVVLLNERGEVSECTSANIFIAEGSRVSTPPISSGCLPGVTRALLLEEVRVPGYQVQERVLLPADLEKADQIFITSTTRELLPVLSVEGLRIQQKGSACRDLQGGFTRVARDYVASAKPAGQPVSG